MEQQTLESIMLLKSRNTPFIIALNKVDRCYGWTECKDMPIRQALKEQPQHTQDEFEKRLSDTIVLFAEQEINAEVYWKNPDIREYVSMVPTSGISGKKERREDRDSLRAVQLCVRSFLSLTTHRSIVGAVTR